MTFIVLLFAAWACSVRTARMDRIGEPVSGERGYFLLAQLAGNSETLKSFEGDALVVYKEGEKTESLRARVAFNRDSAQFRLDLYDFVFKKPVVTVVRNGDEVFAALHLKKKYYRNSYESFDFQNLVDINVSKDILFHSMLGEVYISEQEGKISSKGMYALTVEADNEKTDVLFDDQTLPVQAEYSGDAGVYLVRFMKYRVEGDVQFPRKVTIESGEKMLEMNYTEFSVNRPVSGQLFVLDNSVIADYNRFQ